MDSGGAGPDGRRYLVGVGILICIPAWIPVALSVGFMRLTVASGTPNQ